MNTFKMRPNSQIRLLVKISSDAIVGSNVSLDDQVIKKSVQYNFSVDIGNSNNLNSKTVSAVSNFFVASGNIDAIINSTKVEHTFKDDVNSQQVIAEKVKINDNIFMAYSLTKLKL